LKINFRKFFCRRLFRRGSFLYRLADCVRYERPVLICLDSGLLASQYCPNREWREFIAGTEPKETCRAHLTISLRVCKDSFLLPTDRCPSTIEKEFKRWEAPEERCPIHKEKKWSGSVCRLSDQRPSRYCFQLSKKEMENQPRRCGIAHHSAPVGGYERKNPLHHAQFLGSWNWFRVEAWDPRNETAAIDEAIKLIREMRIYRFSLHDGFFWLSDGRPEHRHLNWRTPWRVKDRVFDLEEWEPRFWELFKIWLEIHRMFDLDYAPQLFMAFGYNRYPFENNRQGIRARKIWDERIREYQLALARRTMETYREVYGDDYRPFVKICNEPAHHGDADLFHRIMYFHQDVFERALAASTDISHLIIDISGCEGSIGELKEWEPRERCPKRGSPLCREGGHGKDQYDRLAVGEVHGYSTKMDWIRPRIWNARRGEWVDNIDPYFGSANRARRFTEDAGGRNGDGLGAVFPPPETGKRPRYRFANAAQRYEAAQFIWRRQKERGRREKRIILGSFPVETLRWVDGLYRADYRRDAWIDWSRFAAVNRAYDEVFGK